MNNWIKYIFLLFLLIRANFLLAQSPLERVLDFEVQQIPISEALLNLSEAADISIAFNGRLFDPQQRISFQIQQKSIRYILKACLLNTGVDFRLEGEQIILYKRPKREYIISGYIEDAQSGERLIAATVWSPLHSRGTTTNNYGFYSLRLPEGEVEVHISYLGYQASKKTIQLTKAQTHTFQLKASLTLPEIVVTQADDANNPQLLTAGAALPISVADITEQPTLGGEADLFRHLQTLPGVSGGADGLGGLHVRGGNTDQNLILLDDVPVYNPSHTLGLFSILNTHSLKSAQFYSDGFSARYGGRLSSVLDVRTREGSTQATGVEVGLGTLATKLLVEGPIVKGKAGFLLSVRRTHLDPLIASMSRKDKQKKDEVGEVNYSFYDINAKIHAAVSDNDRLFLSFYNGKDVYSNTTSWSFGFDDTSFVYNDKQDIRWGNTIAALRWNHLFGDRLFANTTMTYSLYDYRSQNSIEYEESDFNEIFYQDLYFTRFASVLRDFGVKIDFDFYPSPNHHLQFGGGVLRRSFEPGLIELEQDFFDSETAFDDISQLIDTLFDSPVFKATEFDLYVEDQMRLGERTHLSAGLHAAAFQTMGKTYLSLQPRLSVRWKAKKVLGLSLSLSRMTQFLHILSSTGAGLPNDLWVPSTDSVGPQQAWQVAGSITAELAEGWKGSLTAYYKKMDNLISYEEGATLPSLFETDPYYWEENITTGRGWSHGLEVQLKKSQGLTTFQSSYTWSRSDRAFDAVNGGRTYPFRFERRHNFRFSVQHQWQPWLSLHASWTYGTGQPITLVASEDRFAPLNNLSPAPIDRRSDIHGYRLPVYHRLDLSLDFHWKRKQLQHSVSLGAYNLYNRQNPYYVYLIESFDFPEDNGLKKQNSLPLLPTLSYRLAFRSTEE